MPWCGPRVFFKVPYTTTSIRFVPDCSLCVTSHSKGGAVMRTEFPRFDAAGLCLDRAGGRVCIAGVHEEKHLTVLELPPMMKQDSGVTGRAGDLKV